MRRRRNNHAMYFVVGVGLVFLLMYLFSTFIMGAERKAKSVVADYYHYESAQDYSRSWELLHTEMKTKFGRGAFASDRVHVFNGHFGAETFSYEVSKANKLKNWKMEKDGESFGTAYEFEVRQDYHGKYGHFAFVQFVYVVEEDGEWRILWDYKK
ncbi:hypothetical protein [Sutcliffiella horikoshii]|uniref:hypothetical protein n=1 Tax=Sutcliffiella horikoshii TaxID=79883 RepID=UPI003CF19D00